MAELDLETRLARFLAARMPKADALQVTRLERSTEGFSQETFTFDVEITRGGVTEQRSWVAKREPVAGLLEPYDLEPEFRVLHALSDHPLPSPPTPWFERDPTILDRPFYVMERLPGEVPLPTATADGAGPFSDGERLTLGPELARTLAQLHSIDWRRHGLAFLGVPEPGTTAAVRELTRWEARIAASALAIDPALAEALHWLRGHLPRTSELTLVHGDYRLGNFLVQRADGKATLSGVLDWEMVHLGDPHEDLAWCMSAMWRAGTPLAAATLPPEDFAACYAEAAGRPVDPERLRFYEILAVVKMIAIMMTGLRAFHDGRTRDLRMAIFDHQLPFLTALLGMTRGWLAAA